MDLAEYKNGNDVPVKDYFLRRAFGSWNRVLVSSYKKISCDLVHQLKEAPKKVALKKHLLRKWRKRCQIKFITGLALLNH